jgi:hypothetical protein
MSSDSFILGNKTGDFKVNEKIRAKEIPQDFLLEESSFFLHYFLIQQFFQ